MLAVVQRHFLPNLFLISSTFECSSECALRELYVVADLLADLTGSQLLAQADLTECNSPLKIVQIGGDDLFETDDAAGNDYLLDTEAGLSPHA